MRKEEKIIFLLLLLVLSAGFVAFGAHGVWVAVVVTFLLFALLVIVKTEFRRARNERVIQGRDSQAVTAIYATLSPDILLPEMGGYALSPRKCATLLRIMEDKKPLSIVELGSGVSTVVMGLLLKRWGKGRIVSFDHDAKYAQITQEWVRRHGLEDYVEVIHAPINQIQIHDSKSVWYDIPEGSLPETVELLFVDGPPRKTARLARYPALPHFWRRLAPGATVILDDANRPDELRIRDRWLRQYPALFVEEKYSGPEMLVLSRPTNE